MNKLIIVGNGFDLAHGLPTSYNHFMDAFWRDLKDDFDDELVKKMVSLNRKSIDSLTVHSSSNYKEIKQKNVLNNNDYRFKNEFFKQLNEIQSIQNWVDVEDEYYNNLKKIIKEKRTGFGPLITEESKKTKLLRLHKEFEQVKQLLKRYLQKHVVDAYDFSCEEQDDDRRYCFYKEMYPLPFPIDEGKLVKEFSDAGDKGLIHVLLENSVRISKFSKFSGCQILNFNYTPTFENYVDSKTLKKYNIKVNYIHGELSKKIVFGFGDEMDDDYKLIEDMYDNEYLRYFKSFQYVQNSNYKDILRYIDSEKFQVVIMGHSCGLSDRTLLNTIFEHQNCRSIKVFYHKYGEKEGEDNYTEIIQNISRHFNDKKLMRTKIVEKTLCEPMPQIQLPKKE